MEINNRVQSVYNLCFNPNFRGAAKPREWLKLDNNEIVVFPNGIDVLGYDGKWKQIKWEIIDHKVSNLNYNDDSILTKVYTALSDYIRHTE